LTRFSDLACLETRGLRELVARYVDQIMLTAIAEEHAKGRDLLIVMTDLDPNATAVWDMVALLKSGRPKR